MVYYELYINALRKSDIPYIKKYYNNLNALWKNYGFDQDEYAELLVNDFTIPKLPDYVKNMVDEDAATLYAKRYLNPGDIMFVDYWAGPRTLRVVGRDKSLIMPTDVTNSMRADINFTSAMYNLSGKTNVQYEKVFKLNNFNSNVIGKPSTFDYNKEKVRLSNRRKSLKNNK